MKRKLLLCLLAAVLALGVPFAKAASPVRVQVDGNPLSGTSYLVEGVTYAPIRALLNAFGGWTISWDSASRSAVARSGGETVTAGIGRRYITVNGVRWNTPGGIFLKNGSTYVPLRILGEALGAQVEWDPWMSGAAVTSEDFALPGSASDFYWLSRIISAESQGESLEGQIAVGNVILNRVASRDFPNTIPGVIFDREHAVQFEPVSNGTVYWDPTAQSVQAARLVLTGSTAVEGALYFYAPALSEGAWIKNNRPFLTAIGCHWFYL